MTREEIYYEEVKKDLMYKGIKENYAKEMMNNYHLKERLSEDYLFMAHYDPRDIADEIINREAKVYA